MNNPNIIPTGKAVMQRSLETILDAISEREHRKIQQAADRAASHVGSIESREFRERNAAEDARDFGRSY